MKQHSNRLVAVARPLVQEYVDALDELAGREPKSLTRKHIKPQLHRDGHKEWLVALRVCLDHALITRELSDEFLCCITR